MAEPVEMETQAAPEAMEAPPAPEKAEAELPKEAEKATELPKEAPVEITLQTPDGPVTFTQKRPAGRPKKEPKSKPAPRKAKAEKKLVVEQAPPEEVCHPPEKENEPPPPAPLPLIRLSGREKLEAHMRIVQQHRCDAKESQRLKYRALLRA